MKKPAEPHENPFCYLPFNPGDRVCLRMVKNRVYIVESVRVNSPQDAVTYIKPQDGSEANHYYQLRSCRPDGSPLSSTAFWWHSQLELFDRAIVLLEEAKR